MPPEKSINESDLARALASLPHGPEFRFLDRLTELEGGVLGRGEYALRGDEPFLRGHFPDAPLLPGVLLLEAAAQLAGTVAQSDPKLGPMKNLRLTAIRSAKILGTAVPGQTVTIVARITGRLSNLVQADATAFVEGQIVLQTAITLSGE
jgi:3-hydroxyacyl-[acyl-carrier-protein] dehydratase